MRLVALVSALALVLVPLEARALSPYAIAAPPPASSSETSEPGIDIEQAKAEYKLASDAYALGNYEEAIRHFEAAYKLSQEPALLFDLGQAYTRWYDLSNDLGHLEKARRMYENYVINLDATTLDDEEKAHARADAQKRIAEVDRRIADHEDRGNAGPADAGKGSDKPVHKKAWFWVAILGGLAVVGAGVATGVVLGTRRDAFEPELGTIGGQSPGGQSPGGWAIRF